MNVLLIVLLLGTLIGHPTPIPTPQQSAFRGTDYPITVQLKSQNGDPIDNATVFFYQEDQDLLLGTTSTNETGHTTFIWSIPPEHALGPTLLNATFNGDPDRFLLPSFVSIPLTIFAQMIISIEVHDNSGTPLDTVIYPNQTLVFKISVLNDLREPLSDIQVWLRGADNQIILQGRTAANGSLVIAYSLDTIRTARVDFTIQTEKSGYINGSEYKLHFNIANFTTAFVSIPNFLFIGEAESIIGLLTCGLKAYVPNASVELLLDNDQLLFEAKTDQIGRFQLPLNQNMEQLQQGCYLTIRYNGDLGYRSTQVIIGLIPRSVSTPFIQSIKPVPFLGLAILFYQASLVSLTCISIGSAIYARKLKRSTRQIISH